MKVCQQTLEIKMSNFTGSLVLQKENGDKVIIPNRITEKGYDFWTGKDWRDPANRYIAEFMQVTINNYT